MQSVQQTMHALRCRAGMTAAAGVDASLPGLARLSLDRPRTKLVSATKAAIPRCPAWPAKSAAVLAGELVEGCVRELGSAPRASSEVTQAS